MGDHSVTYSTKRKIIFWVCVAIVAILYSFKNTSIIVRTISAISVIGAFYVTDHLFDIRFRMYHYAFILIIAIASFLLSPLYFIYPSYDKIQHFAQPIMLCSLIMWLMRPLQIKTRWKLVFIFFISMGFVGLMEIGEYYLDYFFDLKLQGVFLRDLQGIEKYDILLDRIDDTMIDMALGVLGSLTYCIGIVIHAWSTRSKTL